MESTPSTLATSCADDATSTALQVQDLQILLDVARAMTAAMSLDDLLALILDSACRLLDAERATLFLYDPAAHELYSKIAHGTGEIRFAADRGIAGAVAQSRRAINILDAYADPRFLQQVDRLTGYRTRCLLTMPLTGLDDQLVGVLQVLNKRHGVFTACDERLGETLAAHTGVAIQRAQLMDHYVHMKQLEKSLAIAREIQQSLLPRKLPEVPGYDLAGWNQPADETGGDCFDFFLLPDQRLAVTLADASGHGVGPALIIAETRALLRATCGYVDQAGAALTRVNHLLCADLSDGRFVTAFFAILDPARHVLEYASAGQGPLFWYEASSGRIHSTGATGLPLGLIDSAALDLAPPVSFAAGDMGVFLTDGFTEAHDPQGRLFGAERLCRLIEQHAERPAAAIIGVLAEAVRDFMHGALQLDDLTVVIVKRCG